MSMVYVACLRSEKPPIPNRPYQRSHLRRAFEWLDYPTFWEDEASGTSSHRGSLGLISPTNWHGRVSGPSFSVPEENLQRLAQPRFNRLDDATQKDADVHAEWNWLSLRKRPYSSRLAPRNKGLVQPNHANERPLPSSCNEEFLRVRCMPTGNLGQNRLVRLFNSALDPFEARYMSVDAKSGVICRCVAVASDNSHE